MPVPMLIYLYYTEYCNTSLATRKKQLINLCSSISSYACCLQSTVRCIHNKQGCLSRKLKSEQFFR